VRHKKHRIAAKTHSAAEPQPKTAETSRKEAQNAQQEGKGAFGSPVSCDFCAFLRLEIFVGQQDSDGQ